MYRSVKGMKDLLPIEAEKIDYVIRTAYNVASCYGVEKIDVPLLEHTGVFVKAMGETSDVVSKEMYTFVDKGGDNVTLRPEFTAGIMRSVLEHKLYQHSPLRFFSAGPVCRRERPQHGRYRQFYQINVEYIGIDGEHADAEVLKLACDILHAAGVKDITLEINSLGDQASRMKYEEVLTNYFASYKDKLSEVSRQRLERNPLRILDSKEREDKEIMAGAPQIHEYYTEEALGYFRNVLDCIEKLGINYKINNTLVRGLDYYSGVIFEFMSSALGGSQNTLLAGGRYDGLSKVMGGEAMPAIGFAAGIERMLLASNIEIKRETAVVVIPIEEHNGMGALETANKLREHSIRVSVEYDGRVGKRIQRAVQMQAKYVIFVGDNEENKKEYRIKNLDTGNEEVLTIDGIIRKVL